jgi:hypothetical protein
MRASIDNRRVRPRQLLTRSAILAIYTAALVGILEWAVAGYSGNEAVHRVEAVIPGGVTTLTVAWAVASVWIVVSWFRARTASAVGLSVLGLFFVLVLYLLEWSRRVALPTRGGISPSEVWLLLAGGLRVAFAFGTALTVVVLVGLIRGLRR